MRKHRQNPICSVGLQNSYKLMRTHECGGSEWGRTNTAVWHQQHWWKPHLICELSQPIWKTSKEIVRNDISALLFPVKAEPSTGDSEAALHLDTVNTDIPGSSVLRVMSAIWGLARRQALGTRNRLVLTSGFQEMDCCAGGWFWHLLSWDLNPKLAVR